MTTMTTDAQLAAKVDEMSQPALKWVPVINTDECVGCGTCVATCQHGCLELVWDFSTLVRPDDCVSCGACMTACPHKVIQMDWVEVAGDRTVGRWRTAPQTPAAPARRSWLARLLEKGGRSG
jgi:ferredoxin